MDGRQGRRHLGGIGHIVESDHAHLVWDPNVVLVEDLVHTRGLRVVAGKYRGRRILLIEQMTRLLDTIAQ
jgi:hypothetical protein